MSIDTMPTGLGPIEDELIDHELEALIREANSKRRYAEDRSVQGLPPTIGRLSPDTSNTVLGEGSEPALRPDEKVCEVTGYTYFANLPRSPHIDENGHRTW